MIAAHTLIEAGADRNEIDIISKEKCKSTIGGAQFLHEPIFKDDEPDAEISIVHIGEGAGYATKVYGHPEIETSWDDHDTVQIAWGLQSTYERLWERLEDRILVEVADWIDGEEAAAISEHYATVVSTIPAECICTNPDHSFPSTKFFMFPCVPSPVPLNVIMYSGRMNEETWHRQSNIMGYSWREYPWSEHDRVEEIGGEPLYGAKPMGTNCDCAQKLGIVKAGRFGAWDKKVLLHDVPKQVRAGVGLF